MFYKKKIDRISSNVRELRHSHDLSKRRISDRINLTYEKYNDLNQRYLVLENRINHISENLNKLYRKIDKMLMRNCSHDFIYTFENLEKKCSKCGDKETYSNIDEFIKEIKSDYEKLNK